MSDSERRGPDIPRVPDIGWALDRMEDVRQGVSAFFPPEFREHFRSARREFWLALRSLVDARLEAIEHEREPKPGQQPGPGTHGRIEVE